MSILVFIESEKGKLNQSEKELLSYAAELKSITGTSVTALLDEKAEISVINSCSEFGADKILITTIPDARVQNFSYLAHIIASVAVQNDSSIIIFNPEYRSRTVAPLVAAKLKAGYISGVKTLPEKTEPFIISKPVFYGKAITKICVKSKFKVISLLPNSISVNKNPVPVQFELFEPPFNNNNPARIKLTSLTKNNQQKPKETLETAGIIVSGGRGLGKKENWSFIEELANLLGAATGCTKPAWDSGFCPHDGYIGQTGKTVSPRIYFALGISGAVQHIAGVAASKIIIAINKDPKAPIFNFSNFGIIGDINSVVPDLIKAIKEHRKTLKS